MSFARINKNNDKYLDFSILLDLVEYSEYLIYLGKISQNDQIMTKRSVSMNN